MNKIYIANNKDLFNIDIQGIEAGEITTSSQPSSNINLPIDLPPALTDKTFLSFTVALICLILAIIIFNSLKRIAKKNNAMAEYTKQQIKKPKVKQKAYISSRNKLDTPESIDECIRSFLERTK